MKTLIIIFGILAFIFLLLLFPVRLSFFYEEEASGKIRYLFFSKKFPGKEKKPKKEPRKKETGKRKKKQEEAPKPDFMEIYKKHGVSGFIEILNDVFKALRSRRGPQSHLYLTRASLDLSVSSDNASKTAVEYGSLCSVVYPLISGIMSIIRHGKYEVSVYPDFKKQKTEVKFSAELYMRLIFLLAYVLKSLFKLIPVYLGFRQGKYEKDKNEKESQQNGKSSD